LTTATPERPKTDKGWQAHLSNVRAPAERIELSMGGAMVVVLEKSGAKRFEAKVRRQGERNPRRFPIGNFPAVSVAEARRKLTEIKSVAKEGRDPALERRRASVGLARLRTLADLIREYIGRREGQVAPKTLKIERDLLVGVLVPVLGDRLLSDLEPIDFGKAVADYAARLRREGRSNGTNGNKLLAACRRMFKMARGWGVIGAIDPTAGLSKPAKEAPRDRILFDGKVLVGPDPKVNELGRLVAALSAEPSAVPVSRPARLALLLTLMMGFRALETSSLEWRAINLEGDAPTVAVTSSKTSAGLRTLPLSKAAVEILRELRGRAGKTAGFVFPSEQRAKRVKHMHAESLARAFARACARLRISGASTHDLRRTCLSGLMELGHDAVAERIAGHVPRHVLGRHYDRSSRLDAMRAGLEEWANAIEAARERASLTSADAETAQREPTFPKRKHARSSTRPPTEKSPIV
jgi:integrase